MAIESAHIKGTVKEVGENGTVKVLLPEYGNMLSDWLPVLQSATLGARTWAGPRVDTQVIVLPGLGTEDAVVLGAIYSDPDPAPFEDAAVVGIKADDDVVITYDPRESTLTIKSPKLIKIVATNIEIEADVKLVGNSDITGDVKLVGDSDVTGKIKHSGDMEQTGNAKRTGTLDQTGAASITGALTVSGAAALSGGAAISGGSGAKMDGPVTVSGALEAATAKIGGIPFATHKHLVTSPGNPTGVPV